MTRVWSVPIYHSSVAMYDNRDAMARDIKKLTPENPPDLYKYHGIMEYLTGPDNDDIYMLGVFNRSITTLAHESIHFGIDILERRGIKISSENDEPLTYLVEACMLAFMERYKVR